MIRLYEVRVGVGQNSRVVIVRSSRELTANAAEDLALKRTKRAGTPGYQWAEFVGEVH